MTPLAESEESPRKAEESPRYQGEDESLAYTFIWTAIGTPTSPIVVIKNAALTDMTATNLSGTASIVGDTIVTPLVTALVAGQSYRLECKVTIGGNTHEHWLEIIAEE